MSTGIQVTSSSEAFEELFRLCCKKYDTLQMFVAWVGDVANSLPFAYLQDLTTITVTVGISFCQSHPSGIEHLMKLDKNIRVMNDQPLFHPKVYIFSKGKQKAMLVGSSNFTYSGFYQNIETNIFLEGPSFQTLIAEKELEFIQWRSAENSFKPTMQWLKQYVADYEKRQTKLMVAKVKDEATKEEYAFGSAWINNISWKKYYNEIQTRIEARRYEDAANEVIRKKVAILEDYKKQLAIPWQLSYFTDKEKRKMMWGDKPYAWLGHVGASGVNKQLIKNGKPSQKKIIVDAINTIASLESPVNWQVLKAQLVKLVRLGPTIKFWSRFLAITRPDLYCTFSSPSLIANLADNLDTPKSRLETIDGYLNFLKVVHSSPFFNSTEPRQKLEAGLWKNRVAFLDMIFY